MSLTIKAVAAGKAAWTEGTFVVIQDDENLLGGQAQLDSTPEVAGSLEQFKANPSQEIAAYITAGKSARAALFLSTDQVRYQSSANSLRILGSRAISFARKTKANSVTFALENASTEQIQQILQGVHTAAYTYTKYKSAVDNKPAKLSAQIICNAEDLKAVQALVKHEEVLTTGVNLARDFVNEIPNELYPDVLARQAKAEATKAGLEVTIFDEKRLARERFNGVLTVGRGSNRPPRMTVMSYKPAGKKKSNVHLALVGKAVTFDTGGHSLKQAKGMWEMKGDMAGGAAVIGAMTAIGRMKPGIRITGIVPSAQNAIGPDAVLPGDIIRSRSGKTVHVDNTDAEGRLLLMDALHYAEEIGATHIIDVATLTGSIVRALGDALSGLFSNDDELAQLITQTGETVGEEYWRMPLVEQYRAMLDHPVADIDNVGKNPNAGSIMAALFLKEFVSDEVKWAHLDIAACGLYTAAQRCYAPGATGFAVRTLAEVAAQLGSSK